MNIAERLFDEYKKEMGTAFNINPPEKWIEIHNACVEEVPYAEAQLFIQLANKIYKYAKDEPDIKITVVKRAITAPRYRISQDYPKCPWAIGDILHVESDGGLYGERTGYVQSKYIVKENEAKKYPHIFQPLKWWEYRTVEDMPEYVKGIKIGHPYKVEAHFVKEMCSGKLMGFMVEYGQWHEYDLFIPATEAEYAEFKNKK